MLTGTLSSPSYKGFDSGVKTEIENPQVNTQTLDFLIKPKLSNGQTQWNGEMALQTDLFGVKHWKDGEIPLAPSASMMKKYTNGSATGTGEFNPDAGFFLPDDLKQAYKDADIDRKAREQAVFAKHQPEPVYPAFDEEQEAVIAYFRELKEGQLEQRINNLRAQGFTDKEIAKFIEQEREQAIRTADTNRTLGSVGAIQELERMKARFSGVAKGASPVGEQTNEVPALSVMREMAKDVSGRETPAGLRSAVMKMGIQEGRLGSSGQSFIDGSYSPPKTGEMSAGGTIRVYGEEFAPPKVKLLKKKYKEVTKK